MEIESSWEKPNDENWNWFARAVNSLVFKWDLIIEIMDAVDGSEDSVEIIIDNLLENFADKWKVKQFYAKKNKFKFTYKKRKTPCQRCMLLMNFSI